MPVCGWVWENQPAEFHFTVLRDALRAAGLKAPDGPVSDELTRLRSLGMIEPLPPRGTLKPLRFQEHALWSVIVSAVDVAEGWPG